VSARAFLGFVPGLPMRRYPSGVFRFASMRYGQVGTDRTDDAANTRRSSEVPKIIASQGIFGRYL
jgi:hypothetical protein